MSRRPHRVGFSQAFYNDLQDHVNAALEAHGIKDVVPHNPRLVSVPRSTIMELISLHPELHGTQLSFRGPLHEDKNDPERLMIDRVALYEKARESHHGRG